MYLQRIIAETGARPSIDNKHITHHRSPADNRLIIDYNDRYYSFRTDEEARTAEVRDGLIDDPGSIDDVPLDVRLYVKLQGYRILGTEIYGDVLDADASSVPEAYEIWV